jgi:heme O synthase-like polyprenyltransferase
MVKGIIKPQWYLIMLTILGSIMIYVGLFTDEAIAKWFIVASVVIAFVGYSLIEKRK